MLANLRSQATTRQVTVARFPDGSLAVPARVTTSDGQVAEGITRISRGHPQYGAWYSYCKRHPQDVVDRGQDLGLPLLYGLGVGVVGIGLLFMATYGLPTRAGEIRVRSGGGGAAVVTFIFLFAVGFVGGLWFQGAGGAEPSTRTEVEPPPDYAAASLAASQAEPRSRQAGQRSS